MYIDRINTAKTQIIVCSKDLIKSFDEHKQAINCTVLRKIRSLKSALLIYDKEVDNE